MSRNVTEFDINLRCYRRCVYNSDVDDRGNVLEHDETILVTRRQRYASYTCRKCRAKEEIETSLRTRVCNDTNDSGVCSQCSLHGGDNAITQPTQFQQSRESTCSHDLDDDDSTVSLSRRGSDATYLDRSYQGREESKLGNCDYIKYDTYKGDDYMMVDPIRNKHVNRSIYQYYMESTTGRYHFHEFDPTSSTTGILNEDHTSRDASLRIPQGQSPRVSTFNTAREPIRYDPDFKGPIHNRSCTDIVWLIIFILYLGLWGYVGYYSHTNGSVEKLLAPIDSNGHRCGLDAGYQNKKYLVFFDISKCLSPGTPITGCPTPQVCVEKCPTRTILFNKLQTDAEFEQFKKDLVCVEGIDVATLSRTVATQYMNERRCASYVLQSQAVLFRCIGDLSTMPCEDTSKPSSVMAGSPQSSESCKRSRKKDQATLLNSATALDSYVGWIIASWVTFFTTNASERDAHVLSSQIVQDLVQSRWYMLGALVAVVLLCFIYILLLRWVVAPVVWTSIIGLFALLGFSLYLCYKNYDYYKANPVQLISTTNVKGYFQSVFTQASTWLVILIIVAILLVVLLMIVIFLRGRIVIAIALIKEGSKAVTAIKSTILFPIFPWVLQCATIAYGASVLLHLVSIGDAAFKTVQLTNDTTCNCNGVYTQDYVDCDPIKFSTSCFDNSQGFPKPCQMASCHFTGIDNPNHVIYLHLANLLGFFWAWFFISGVADMMLASTFSTWYWTFRKKDLPFFTLTSGISRTICYHLGTVAFGALIIAIVRVIRVILEYIDHKLKKFDNPFTRCVMCCCKCFFWCLENFIKFINKNAYIMCAIHGKNFCSSARDAFSLLMRNIVRVVVLDKVMDFIFFLSKLLISIGVGFAVYYLLQWNMVYEITGGQRLNSNYVPAIILSVVTYLVCTIFFNVYAMAVDTLFLCFLEDCERNDGSPEKPYFMSTNLMKILGKKNKIH